MAAAVAAVLLVASAFLLRKRLGRERAVLALVLALGLFVFAMWAITIASHPGPTPFDKSMLDLARDLRVAAAVDLAKVVTFFGTLPVVATVTAVATAFLVRRRRLYEVAVLVGSLILIVVLVYVIKQAVDRPRPPHHLVSATSPAFPSGHAAYSTVYVALAVIAARVLGERVRGSWLVLAAVAFAVAIGLTRIYLQVHWWSDVGAGWALGAAIFALLTAAAVAVSDVRENGTPESHRTDPRGTATERV